MGKLENLETFVKVVEANSLVLAAKQLDISSAAVSKQISALEEELRVSLLRRTTRRLELTELGQLYYEHSKRLMNKMEDLNGIISSLQAEPVGCLSMLSSRYFADQYIVPHLPEFFARYPKVTLDIRIAGREGDLTSDGVDLFFGIAHPPPFDFVQKEIAQGHFSLCASPAYLSQHGTPKQPHDLVHHRFISYSLRGHNHQLSFNNGAEIYLNPLLTVSDTKMMISCALQGLGFIKLHQLEAEKHLAAGTLIELLPSYREVAQPIYLGYQQHRYLQPKVRHFVEFYLEKLKK